MVNAPSASTLVKSGTVRVSDVTLPLPLMPVMWQPPSARAAKVNSFAAANGRIVMVFIGIGSLLNEMQLQGDLDSEIDQLQPRITRIPRIGRVRLNPRPSATRLNHLTSPLDGARRNCGCRPHPHTSAGRHPHRGPN